MEGQLEHTVEQTDKDSKEYFGHIVAHSWHKRQPDKPGERL